MPYVAEAQPDCDPSHWVFAKADWEQIHAFCFEKITEDFFAMADLLGPFVKHTIKVAAFPGQPLSPRNQTLDVMNAGKPWRQDVPWKEKADGIDFGPKLIILRPHCN